MKKIKKIGSEFVTLWSRFGKYVFCALSVTAAVLITLFGNCDRLILILAIVSSVLVYFRLRFANRAIKSRLVRLSWACIDFLLFITICQLCAIRPTRIDASYPDDIHALGLFLVCFANTFLYGDIPILTQKLRIADVENAKYYQKGNLCGLSVLTYLVILAVVFCIENSQLNAYRYERQPFEKVVSWEKEVYRRHTVYFIKTENGSLLVDPYIYPEIRDISTNTRIKVENSITNVRYFPKIQISN